jgi:hypothetical protein
VIYAREVMTRKDDKWEELYKKYGGKTPAERKKISSSEMKIILITVILSLVSIVYVLHLMKIIKLDFTKVMPEELLSEKQKIEKKEDVLKEAFPKQLDNFTFKEFLNYDSRPFSDKNFGIKAIYKNIHNESNSVVFKIFKFERKELNELSDEQYSTFVGGSLTSMSLKPIVGTPTEIPFTTKTESVKRKFGNNTATCVKVLIFSKSSPDQVFSSELFCVWKVDEYSMLSDSSLADLSFDNFIELSGKFNDNVKLPT